jgi:hypothetical protein
MWLHWRTTAEVRGVQFGYSQHTETFTSLLRVELWDEGGTGYYGVPAESKSKGF